MEMKNQRKPLLYYWLIALLVMGVINMFFLPFMAKNSIQQVNYDVFLTEMQEKNISQAEINEDVIYFFLRDESTDSAEQTTTIFADGNAPKVYATVRMDDPQLVERLYEAGASFGEVRPKEISPWVSTLIMFLLFFFGWRMITKRFMGKMGGPTMSFGKANAKIYVKAQTGKTFKDVAGQDEAKEALNEIVDFLHNPQKYTEVGAKMPKGALLVGPPCSNRQMKKPPVSYSSMRSIPSAKNVMEAVWAETMKESRP